MDRGSFVRALALAVSACASLSACNAESAGTCDRSTVEGVYQCIEVTGPSRDVSNSRGACTDTDGTWSTEPCPEEDSLGCCLYTLFGMEFRECVYVGSTASNVETICETTYGGTWEPGPAADGGL